MTSITNNVARPENQRAMWRNSASASRGDCESQIVDTHRGTTATPSGSGHVDYESSVRVRCNGSLSVSPRDQRTKASSPHNKRSVYLLKTTQRSSTRPTTGVSSEDRGRARMRTYSRMSGA